MQYGIIQGSVVASQKVDSLKGIPLKLMVPCDSEGSPVGEPFVAADCVGARPGDMVLWVGKREASLAIPLAAIANDYPIDAAVTGIVDAVS